MYALLDLIKTGGRGENTKMKASQLTESLLVDHAIFQLVT